MRLARRLVLTWVVLLVAAAPASAAPFTINVRGSADRFGRVLAIGDFKPDRDPTLRAAIAAYGQPSFRRSPSPESCKVGWHELGVKVLFANFGRGSACSPDLGRSQTARAFGERWHTVKGLGVGQRLVRLRRLYPAATRHGRTWWLVTAVNLFGEPRRYPVLSATVRGGTVRSFSLRIFAAGD